MLSPAPYTPEEWALLARAPFMTGLLITLAAPSGLSGVLEEASAVNEALLHPAPHPQIERLIQDIHRSKGQLAKLPQPLSSKTALPTALQTLSQVGELLKDKATPEERLAFGEWLVNIARQTAQAAKEGGVLGLGGVWVDRAEEQALHQLRQTLEVPSS